MLNGSPVSMESLYNGQGVGITGEPKLLRESTTKIEIINRAKLAYKNDAPTLIHVINAITDSELKTVKF